MNGGSSLAVSQDSTVYSNLRHLHQPEEDEYEEEIGDSDDDGMQPDITPLVDLMNSSTSPSDSELSRCGSQAGLSSESEEEEESFPNKATQEEDCQPLPPKDQTFSTVLNKSE